MKKEIREMMMNYGYSEVQAINIYNRKIDDEIKEHLKEIGMKHLILTADSAEKIANVLQEAGYSVSKKQQYIRYFITHGDSTYISHSLNVIRSVKNTKGHQIIINMFGEANGKASECHDDKYDSWFFNGYTGKAGSKVY